MGQRDDRPLANGQLRASGRRRSPCGTCDDADRATAGVAAGSGWSHCGTTTTGAAGVVEPSPPPNHTSITTATPPRLPPILLNEPNDDLFSRQPKSSGFTHRGSASARSIFFSHFFTFTHSLHDRGLPFASVMTVEMRRGFSTVHSFLTNNLREAAGMSQVGCGVRCLL